MAWKIGASVATLTAFPSPPTTYYQEGPNRLGYTLNGKVVTCGKPSITLTFNALSAADFKFFVDEYDASANKVIEAPKVPGLAGVSISDPSSFEWGQYSVVMEPPTYKKVHTGLGVQGVYEEITLVFNQVDLV